MLDQARPSSQRRGSGYRRRMSHRYFVLTLVLLPLLAVAAFAFAAADVGRAGAAGGAAFAVGAVAGLLTGGALLRARASRPLERPQFGRGAAAGAAGGAIAGMVDGLPAWVRAGSWALCGVLLLVSTIELVLRRRVTAGATSGRRRTSSPGSVR